MISKGLLPLGILIKSKQLMSSHITSNNELSEDYDPSKILQFLSVEYLGTF